MGYFRDISDCPVQFLIYAAGMEVRRGYNAMFPAATEPVGSMRRGPAGSGLYYDCCYRARRIHAPRAGRIRVTFPCRMGTKRPGLGSYPFSSEQNMISAFPVNGNPALQTGSRTSLARSLLLRTITRPFLSCRIFRP